MSQYRKILGSLCIFGFEGPALPPLMSEIIREWNLGGVILFKRNIESKEQVKDLIKEIKSCQNEVPLFVSVDHEGGRVFRLPPPFTQIPPAREIARSSPSPQPSPSRGEGERRDSPLPSEGEGARRAGEGEVCSAFEWGIIMGRELREVGFNLNFAPVLDVDSNPNNPIIGDRSFGSDPHTVIQCALDLMEGLRSEGIIPCGKHFPGHGDTSKDSHLELPRVEKSAEQLEAIELLPFRAALEDKIEMLMTAHVLYPALDSQLPATLSPKILNDLLRQKMSYEGVVISDDFNMKAISETYGLGEAARLFLEAGGDIPLICRGEEAELGALEYLLKELEKGHLNRKHLELSQKRILKLKSKIV